MCPAYGRGATTAGLDGFRWSRQQTFIDTYAKVGFAKLYDRKTPITAADLLNDRVIPFHEEHGVPLSRILTDRGTEYCGSHDRHEYELYLAVENIDHSRTKTKSPQTNGIVERFHKTMLDEFYRIAFRKTIYATIDELQADLDAWLIEYNEARPHQGRYCFGKTPMQTFLDAAPARTGKSISGLRPSPHRPAPDPIRPVQSDRQIEYILIQLSARTKHRRIGHAGGDRRGDDRSTPGIPASAG